jgi:predicted O-methyltransferase YrrM
MLATTDHGRRLAIAMYERFQEEIRPACDETARHAKAILNGGLVSGGTSSIEDCALLYLLVRYFNRKHVFEIGTYIATTAVAMNTAVRKNGGVLTTSDPVHYGSIPPYSGIRFIHGPSRFALHILQEEAVTVDFCFMDWVPDAPSLAIAQKTFTPDAVIAVHDYLPNDKGEMIVARLNETYCKDRPGRWFEPNNTPWRMKDGMTINYCTAFFVPDLLPIPEA